MERATITDELLEKIATTIKFENYRKPDEGYWCHGEWHDQTSTLTVSEIKAILEDSLEGTMVLRTVKSRHRHYNSIKDIKDRRFKRGIPGPQGRPGRPGKPGDKGDRGDAGMMGCTGTPGRPGRDVSRLTVILLFMSTIIISAAVSAVITSWIA